MARSVHWDLTSQLNVHSSLELEISTGLEMLASEILSPNLSSEILSKVCNLLTDHHLHQYVHISS